MSNKIWDICGIMWLKQCHKTSPSHHHFYRWYVYHSQSWVVYDIVLSTWNTIGGSQSYGRFFTSPTGPSQSYGHDFYSHPIDPERWVSVVPGSYIWGLHLQSSSRSVFHHHGAGIWIPTFTPKMTQLLCSQKYSSTMGCICYLGTLLPTIPLRIWRNWPFLHSKCCNCVVENQCLLIFCKLWMTEKTNIL